MGDAGPAIWLIGEAMIELRAEGADQFAAGVAGDTLNTAIYLSRLVGRPHAVGYVTALGRDRMSDRILAALARERLSAAHVVRRTGMLPGLYLINTDPRGERSFDYWRGQSAARSMLDQAHTKRLIAALPDCRLLAFSAISLAILDTERRRRLIELAAAARRSGALVAFDSNYRPALWSDREEARTWCRAAFQAVEIALVSGEDEAALWDEGAAADRIAAFGCGEIVVKNGAEPALLHAPDGQRTIAAVPAERVIDTTAAGDSFNAGYLTARLAGAPPERATAAGHRLAARVIGHAGAICPEQAMAGLRLPAPPFTG